MYHSLEVRVPFCDYRIAEYLYAVPWAYKDHGGVEKGLLRTAMKGLVPDEILWRKKSPYPKTFDPAYTERIGKRLQQVLDDKASPLHSLVNTKVLGEMLREESPWPWYGQLMGRPQTMAYFVQLDFWLRHYKVRLV